MIEPSEKSGEDRICALLSFHLSGSLSEEEDASFRDHLASCAACRSDMDQLSDVAAAIERHGTELSSGRSRFFDRRFLSVAAVLVFAVSALIIWRVFMSGPTGPTEVHLSLGAGAMRGEGGQPSVTVGPSTGLLLITYDPPPIGGDDRWTSIVDEAGRRVLPERSVGEVDEMGRATVPIPVSSLARAGTYSLVVRTGKAEGAGRLYTYPFTVEFSDTNP